MRTLPLKVLTAGVALTALSASSIAFAAEGGMQFRNPFAGRASLDAELSEEDQTELQALLTACRENNSEDHEAKHTCATEAFASFGIELPERPVKNGLFKGQWNELDANVQTELEACRTDNSEDRAAAKTCITGVFEANGIEMPVRNERGQKRGHMMFDANLSDEAKAELEACKTTNEEDHDAKHECVDAVLEANGIEAPERPERIELSDEVKVELEACHTSNEDDREAMHTCAEGVFEANGIEAPEHGPRHGRKHFELEQGSEIELELEAELTL